MPTPAVYPNPTLADSYQNGGIPNNPLDDKPEILKKSISQIYSEEDREYLGFLQVRLESAKRAKDQPYAEFKGKTYYQYYDSNEKIANTFLPEKKNDDDVIVSAGTVEQKLDALLSNVNNLNLSPEVFAFDKENNKITELGLALQDIIHDTEVRDGGDGAGDEEKKMARQRELLKQGTVFVQEEWLKRWEIKKTLKKKMSEMAKDELGRMKFKQDPDFYSKELVKVFEGPSRNLLYGPNVFLGDVTKFYMDDQPFVFVVIHEDYDVAKARYQKFENWKYVQKGKTPPSSTTEIVKTIYDNKWRLTELKSNQVEIILYQDQTRDEFQIIINGVCMLPIGFPLSAVSPRGKYNIAKQIFRIINEKFAYGASFVGSGSVKEISNLIDEMLKLFVLKTRKSYTPPYVNTSGRVIDRKVLSAGRISMGIDPGALQAIGTEGQGVTAGEIGVLKELQDLINKSTVSEQFTGQQGKSGTTATEVLELQRQARMTLGLTIAVCALLEKKLAYLRLWNILENWFEPIDTKVEGLNEARKLVNKFRNTNRDVMIEGEGMGERMVLPTDGELPSAETIRDQELLEEKQKGVPVRKIFVSPEGLRNAELFWYIVVNPRERESSALSKIEFREELNDVLALMQMGSMPNKEEMENEFSRVHGKARTKLFKNMGAMMPEFAGAQPKGEARGRGNPAGMSQMPGGMAGALA